MWPSAVVEAEIAADADRGLGHAGMPARSRQASANRITGCSIDRFRAVAAVGTPHRRAALRPLRRPVAAGRLGREPAADPPGEDFPSGQSSALP